MEPLKLSGSMDTTRLSSYDSVFLSFLWLFAACRAVGLAEEGLSLPFVLPLRIGKPLFFINREEKKEYQYDSSY
jgi:hypothetical protein